MNTDKETLERIRAMEYINAWELSELTGISKQRLVEWTFKGWLSYLDCGKTRRYRTATVLSELASLQVKEGGE